MDIDLAQKAVSHALSGNWKEAIEANRLILKQDPKDTEALNRLAKAYAETGDLKKAKSTAEKVLKIDPFNPIAQKSIAKWKGVKTVTPHQAIPVSTEAFLEEPGKTKLVTLLHPGDRKVLAKLDSGDEVLLAAHSHRVSVVSQDSKYLGRLPDDLSARLRRLMKYGNKYRAFVKSINEREVKIFLREKERAKEIEDVPSFSSEKIDYISFTPPELVHKKPAVGALTDEEE